MNDGESLFDQAYTDNGKEWNLDEVLDSLNDQGKGEFIVVGISSGEKRFVEYSPYATKKKLKNLKESIICHLLLMICFHI